MSVMAADRDEAERCGDKPNEIMEGLLFPINRLAPDELMAMTQALSGEDADSPQIRTDRDSVSKRVTWPRQAATIAIHVDHGPIDFHFLCLKTLVRKDFHGRS
jgi:hypothetical protein